MPIDRTYARRQRINRKRRQAAAGYPELWSRLIAEWMSSEGEDSAWLMYSANYLFRTAGVRWALDPLSLKQRVKFAPDVNLAQDLAGLSFVALTHAHRDHLDLDLLRQLRPLSIDWLIPPAVWSIIEPLSILPKCRVILAEPMISIEMKGVRITPFDGLHWEAKAGSVTGQENAPRGIPATGYLVEFHGKRWLFPGDTRRYEARLLPRFGPINGLFAHLWLGRGCAAINPPPLLDNFCQFCADLQPGRVIVTHLEEFGRDQEDFWDIGHFQQVLQRFRETSPGIPMTCAVMGDRVDL